MEDIKVEVQKKYAAIATKAESGCCSTSSASASACCGSSDDITQLVEYGQLDADLVEGANLGLGCGMPTQNAAIQRGDTVLDLGSGAGVDVFLASKSVGPEGRAIGVDMTPEMIARAWDNALKGEYRNVDFRLGDIEALPVDSGTVDVVLSNCVINLVPNKQRVFGEVYRVLRNPDPLSDAPGGRFSISDVVSYGEIPQSIRGDIAQWTGCIAGAMDRDEYLQLIRDAGFDDVEVKSSVEYDYLKGDDYGVMSITVEGRKA